MKYFKFKENFVFNDKWRLCTLSGDTLYWQDLFRWDWVKTTYEIDLFTGDINEVFASFEWTYLKNLEVKRKVWKVTELIEVSEEIAIDIVKNNQLSVSYLLAVQIFVPVILENHDNSKAIWWNLY